jgi:hypothetical protein
MRPRYSLSKDTLRILQADMVPHRICLSAWSLCVSVKLTGNEKRALFIDVQTYAHRTHKRKPSTMNSDEYVNYRRNNTRSSKSMIEYARFFWIFSSLFLCYISL